MKVVLLISSIFAVAQGYVTLKNTHNEKQFLSGPSVDYGDTYTLTSTFRLPYANIVQPTKISVDGVKKLQFVEYYNGLDSYLYDLSSGASYEVFVRKDKKKCSVTDSLAQTKFFTRNHEAENDLVVNFFPNLQEFKYEGLKPCPETLKVSLSDKCHYWHKEVEQFKRTSTYTFIAKNDKDFTPIMYTMVGYDVPFSSHYDLYEITFHTFIKHINEKDFQVSDICETTIQKDHILKHTENLEELHHLFNGVDHVHHKFEEYNRAYNKNYENDEEFRKAKEIFRNNKFIINDLNRKSNGATYAVNHMANQNLGTKKQCFLNSKPKNLTQIDYHKLSGNELPDSVDWRLSGAVSPVKDQAICGSCWSFAASEAIESAWFLATGVMSILSPQHLVDCSWKYGNLGCDGGNEGPSFQYVIDHGGIMSEQDYPYTGQDGYCKFDEAKIKAKVSSFKTVPEGDEEALKDAVAQQPVAIAYDASLPGMTFYSSGVYYDPKCSSTDLDHAVMIVGYGTTEDGEDYWIVKNSWSTFYGDMGYFKIARNKNNQCGIATIAQYPISDLS